MLNSKEVKKVVKYSRGFRTERVQQMMQNFVRHWKDGLYVPQIAEKYGLSASTVYLRLAEIAESNGLTRDELLQQPRTVPITSCNREKLDRVQFDQVKEELEQLIGLTTETLDELQQFLKEKTDEAKKEENE